ncbi:MAG: metallophosphoesterase, partial [Alphaproteobacteria bacterium]|nr:metallophosphoesterase [Alphaproteobacteria bacterium]
MMFKHYFYALAALGLVFFLAACDQAKMLGDTLGMQPPPQSTQASRSVDAPSMEATAPMAAEGTSKATQPDNVPASITLLHMNDFHSQVDPLMPSQEPAQGGAARLKTLIDGIRSVKGEENTLLLFGGDAFQGTMFYNTWKGSAEVMVMNQQGFDAVCLGNHEFDSGPEQLEPALTEAP